MQAEHRGPGTRLHWTAARTAKSPAARPHPGQGVPCAPAGSRPESQGRSRRAPGPRGRAGARAGRLPGTFYFYTEKLASPHESRGNQTAY